MLIFHVYAKVPAPTTFVFTAQIGKGKGPYGTEGRSQVPSITSGQGSVTSFKVKINKTFTYKGKKQSVLTATCKTGRFFTKGDMKFSDGTEMQGKCSAAVAHERLARGLEDEDLDSLADGPRVGQAQSLLSRLAEEPLAAAEDDRKDHQAQLVDEVLIEQPLHELGAAMDDHVAVMRRPDPRHPGGEVVAGKHGRVVPLGVGQQSETTYFGIPLNLSANSPSREGQASAKPS